MEFFVHKLISNVPIHGKKPETGLSGADAARFFGPAPLFVYSVHATTRKSLGDMTRKLSLTESHRLTQFRGTFSRRNSSVASANWAHVA